MSTVAVTSVCEIIHSSFESFGPDHDRKRQNSLTRHGGRQQTPRTLTVLAAVAKPVLVAVAIAIYVDSEDTFLSAIFCLYEIIQ